MVPKGATLLRASRSRKRASPPPASSPMATCPTSSASTRAGTTTRTTSARRKSTDAENVFKEAGDWVEQHKDERFFAYVHTIDPHVPYDPPAEFLNMYIKGEYAGAVSPRKTPDQLAEPPSTSRPRSPSTRADKQYLKRPLRRRSQLPRPLPRVCSSSACKNARALRRHHLRDHRRPRRGVRRALARGATATRVYQELLVDPLRGALPGVVAGEPAHQAGRQQHVHLPHHHGGRRRAGLSHPRGTERARLGTWRPPACGTRWRSATSSTTAA